MSAFTCGHPEHVGDRLIRHPFDQFVKKVTYRRIDAAVRLHEHEVMRLCRACVDLDARTADAGVQLPLGG